MNLVWYIYRQIIIAIYNRAEFMIAKYIQIIKQQKHPVRFLIASALMYSGISNFLLVKRNGYVLRFGQSAISRLLWIDSNALEKDEKFYGDYLRKNDTYIDIGANIGHLTCRAAQIIGDKATAICVEANSKTFMTLKENLRLNKLGNVQAVCCAIGEYNGVLSFNDTGSDDIHHIDTKATSKNSIPCLTLDTFCQLLPDMQKPAQSFLKIDIEGFELFAFKGGTKLLELIDTVYFECNEKFCRRYNHTQSDVIDVLAASGFDIYEIQLDSITAINKSTLPQKANLIAVRDINAFIERTGYKLSA